MFELVYLFWVFSMFCCLQVLEIFGNGGLLDVVQDLDFMFGFNFEGFFNRDLIMYIDEYSIQLVKIVFRGIIRYKVTKILIYNV